MISHNDFYDVLCSIRDCSPEQIQDIKRMVFSADRAENFRVRMVEVKRDIEKNAEIEAQVLADALARALKEDEALLK